MYYVVIGVDDDVEYVFVCVEEVVKFFGEFDEKEVMFVYSFIDNLSGVLVM